MIFLFLFFLPFGVWIISSLVLVGLVIRTIILFAQEIHGCKGHEWFYKLRFLFMTIPGLLALMPLPALRFLDIDPTVVLRGSLALLVVFVVMIGVCRRWDSWEKVREMVVCGLVCACSWTVWGHIAMQVD